jgi:hypothetical protein
VDSCQIPEGASCLTCGRRIGEIEGFVRLTAGAILYSDRKRTSGGPSETMDTVLSLWYHGPHPVTGKTEGGKTIIGMDNQEFSMDIVEPLRGGQVDIHFCSSPCLSAFFAEIVAAFNAGIERTTTTGDANEA